MGSHITLTPKISNLNVHLGYKHVPLSTNFPLKMCLLDQKMRGNVLIDKMREKTEEGAGRTEWMSRVNGPIEVE